MAIVKGGDINELIGVNFLRLDCTNDPLTATLETQALVPSADATYGIGSSSLKYTDIWCDGIYFAATRYFIWDVTRNQLTMRAPEKINYQISDVVVANATYTSFDINSGLPLKFKIGGKYCGFQPVASPGDNIWILPSADSAGFWKSDGSDNLSIVTLTVSDISDIATYYLKLDCSNDPLVGDLNITGTLDITGFLAVGSDAFITANSALYVFHRYTNDADNRALTATIAQTVPMTSPNYAKALGFESNYSGTGVEAYRLLGIHGHAKLVSGCGDVDGARGMLASVLHESSSTLGSAIGGRTSVAISGGGTINIAANFGVSNLDISDGTIVHLAGLGVENPNVTGSGAITNFYGLHLPNFTGPGTSWGIHQTGSNPNLFSGDVYINTQKELRFYDANMEAGGANYVGFEAPALSADQIWVLPTADALGAWLSDNSGNLSIGLINDTHIDWGTGANQVSAIDLPVSIKSGATYDDTQDFINFFGQRTITSGGTITATNPADGTIVVAACTAWCKATDSDTAVGNFFDFAGVADVALTDLSVNYIYLDYNAGTPQVVVATAIATHGFKHDHILVGVVFRNGNDTHIHNSDNIGVGGIGRSNMHWTEHFLVHRVSGMITSSTGTRNLDIDAGVLYAGLSRNATNAFDTSATDTFSYWYYDGDAGPAVWVEVVNQTQIDKLQYNNVATGLANLTANRYGVHWVYMDNDGQHIHVVYGQGDYTASQAELARIPASLPPIVTGYCVLIAKIILRQNTDTMLISYPWTSVFQTSLATDHGSLAGLGDDDHTIYLLADGTRALAGAWDMGNQNLTNVDIDTGDIANAVVVGGVTASNLVDKSASEAIAGEWTYSTFPITPSAAPDADYEVANKKYVDDNAGVAAHAILDGSVHTDSVADGVTRGSLIYGNATPKWDELVIGAAGTFLKSDGTDVAYAVHGLVYSDIKRSDCVTYALVAGDAVDNILNQRPWTDETVTEGEFQGQVDVPRNVVIFTLPELFQTMTGTVTVNGIDADGAVIQEVFTINDAAATTHSGDRAFARITSVVADQTDATSSDYTVGTGLKLGLPNYPFSVGTDCYKVNVNGVDIGLASGGLWTVNATYGTVQMAGINAGETHMFWYRPFK